MSELALFLVRIGFLAVMWIFVFSIISVIRADLFGQKVVGRAAKAAGGGGGAGAAEIEVDGVVHTLGTGDFISYPASLPHRHRSTLGSEARLVIVETQLQRSQRGAHSDASAEAS